MINYLKNYLLKKEREVLYGDFQYRINKLELEYREGAQVLAMRYAAIERENSYLYKTIADMKMLEPVPPIVVEVKNDSSD